MKTKLSHTYILLKQIVSLGCLLVCLVILPEALVFGEQTKAVSAYRAASLVQQINKNKEDLHLFFVGDINLGRHIEPHILKTEDPKNIFPFVSELFSLADLRFGNLECILSNAPSASGSRSIYFMRAKPETVRALEGLSFDVLSLANNHSLDAGTQGLDDTIRNLDQSGIQIVGIPREEGMAQIPTTVERKKIRLGFLAYNDVTTSIQKRYPRHPFTANEETIKSDIQKAKENHDIVIVNFHWGREYDHLATSRQRELAQIAKQAGADIVIGQHPHVLQEIEWDESSEQLTAYSLGNFIFDIISAHRLRKVRRSMILYVRVDARTKKVKEFIPLSIYINENFQPIPFFEETSLESLIVKDHLEESKRRFDLRRDLRNMTVSLDDLQETLVYDVWKKGVIQFSFFSTKFPGEIVLHERWQLGDDVRSSVGKGAEFSHGEFRKVVWLNAPQNKVLRIKTLPMKLPKTLSGFVGFPDWAMMDSGEEPVEIRFFVGDSAVDSRILRNSPGWNYFDIDLSQFEGQVKPIQVELTTQGSQKRYVAFNLWCLS